MPPEPRTLDVPPTPLPYPQASPRVAATTGLATITHPTAFAGVAAILAAATPVLFQTAASSGPPVGSWGWVSFGLTCAAGLVAVLKPKTALPPGQ